MVLFGVLALFFVAYLLWSLIFPPLKPQEELPGFTRPQMRLATPKAAEEDASPGAPSPAMPAPTVRKPVKPPVAPPPVYKDPGR
ncbi:hypothetical protein llg_41470 [Luteolibacter sp. LG18]|nr:hypothetical protein llg_41470 [Luteolibacter sp. LG18]